MQWEKLKEAVAEYVDALPATEFNQIRCNAQGANQTVTEYLATVDIRTVSNLREHARPAFPKTLRRGTLWADCRDYGWVVDTKDPRKWSR